MSYYVPVWDDGTPINASQATVIMENSPQLPQLKPQGFTDRQINAINKLNQLNRDYTSQQSSYQPVSETPIDFEARNASAQEDIDQVKNAFNNARNQRQSATPKTVNVYTRPININMFDEGLELENIRIAEEAEEIRRRAAEVDAQLKASAKADYENHYGRGSYENRNSTKANTTTRKPFNFDNINLTPEELNYLKVRGSQALQLGTGIGIAADTLFGDDRWDRKAVNLTGNAIGAAIGNRFGGAGRALGAIGGGWLSDRVADIFDDNDGKNAKPTALPVSLLNQHLSKDPIMQIAIYEEQLRQARLQQKEMERQLMAMARMQAQSLQPSYSRSFGNRTLPAFTNNGTMVNPYEDIGM